MTKLVKNIISPHKKNYIVLLYNVLLLFCVLPTLADSVYAECPYIGLNC